MRNRHHRRFWVALAVAPVLAASSHAFAQTVYTGVNDGDWNTAGNWTLGLPTGAVDARINNNASNVNVNLSGTGNVQSLTIDSGDSLTLSNNSTLNINGNLVLNGLLKSNAAANISYLNFHSATATVTGSGTLDFNYTGPSSLRLQTPGSGRISNSSLMRGGAYFYDIRFTNNAGGILENHQAATDLYLDAFGATGSFVNNGTIRALAGATVTLAGDFGGDDSFSGTGIYRADGANAILRFLNDAAVIGGTFQTANGGEVVVETGHAGNASSFVNSGTFRLRNNSRLNVSGNITNSGTFFVSPTANTSYFRIAGDTALSGTGSLVFNSTPSGGDAVIDGSGVLTIGASQTIRGDAYFYDMRVVNNGTILADDSTSNRGGMYIDAWGGGSGNNFVNNGTIRVVANNVLSLVGDFGGPDWFSGNGTYRADGTNAFLHLANGVDTVNGTWTTTTGGEIRVPTGHTARMTTPTITSSSIVAVQNNARLYLNGTIANAGTIEVRSGANESYLTIESDVALTGTGTVVLTSNPGVSNARVDGSGVLTIGNQTTVSGNGWFYNMKVVNNGTILADRATGSMYLDAVGDGAGGNFVNNGTIRAAAGATVSLSGENGGLDAFTGPGTYRADGTGAVINLINGAELVGGVVTTTAGGVVQVPTGHAVSVTDTTISANSRLDVANNARLYLNGTPTINGVLAVNSVANESYLTIGGTTNLNIGTLELNSNPGVSSARIDGGGVLNIGPNFTVSGNGFFYNMKVVNNGTILADRATGSMYLDAVGDGAGGNFVNSGTIKAAAGASLTLAGENGGNDFFSGSGTYRADGTGATVNLINGVEIVGGNYTTTAGGLVRVAPNHVAHLTNPTVTAGSTFDVPNNGWLYVNQTVVNNGTLRVVSGANEARVLVPSDTTFSGPGVTRLTSNPAVSNARIDGAGRLTIAAGHTLAGGGLVYDIKLTNNGTIVADQPTVNLYIDANGSTGAFINNGTMRAAAGATLTFAGENGGDDSFNGPGALIADGTIQSVNGAEGNLGNVTGAGNVRAASSSTLGYKSIRVGGAIIGDGGTVRITQGGGNAGTSKSTSVSILNNGRIDLTDHGLIVDYTAGNSPAATIRGYIASGRNGGFWNGSGIISSLANNTNSRAIGYGEASAIFAAPTSFLGQAIDGTSVLIRYTILGDLNLDGTVNFGDLLILAQNYDSDPAVTNKVWTTGDINYDGRANFSDLLALAQNYNSTLALSDASLLPEASANFAADWALAVSMVPEPASLSVLLGLAMVSKRRRK